MQTLKEEQFNTRVSAFLGRTGLRLDDPRNSGRGRPESAAHRSSGDALRRCGRRTRILAFIGICELDSGGARAAPGRRRGPRPTPPTVRRRKSGAMTARPSHKRTKPPIRFLRVPEEQARTDS